MIDEIEKNRVRWLQETNAAFDRVVSHKVADFEEVIGSLIGDEYAKAVLGLGRELERLERERQNYLKFGDAYYQGVIALQSNGKG